MKTWKCRYFILDGHDLTYRAAPTDPDIRGGGIVTKIDVWGGHENGLVFYLQSGRQIYAYSQSLGEQLKWYRAMEPVFPPTCINTAMASSSTTSSPKSSYVSTSACVLPTSDATMMQQQGWLFKQGRAIKSWKRRYFALSGCVLSYRVSEEPLARVKGSGRILDVEISTSRTYGLDIRMERNRILHVNAATHAEQNQWYEALRVALQPTPRLNPNPTTPYLSQDLDHETQAVQLAGYLLKQGQNIKSWKRRYFELSMIGSALSYRVSEMVPEVLFADTVIAVERWTNSKRMYGLQLRFEKGRLLYVDAETPALYERWYQALLQCTEASTNG